MIMCDYCALSPSQRRRLLERVGEILAPGGAFLFDVYSLAAFETWEEQVAYGPGLMDGFWSAQPYYGFLNTFRYEAERVVLEKYAIVERDRDPRVPQLVPALRRGQPDGGGRGGRAARQRRARRRRRGDLRRERPGVRRDRAAVGGRDRSTLLAHGWPTPASAGDAGAMPRRVVFGASRTGIGPNRPTPAEVPDRQSAAHGQPRTHPGPRRGPASGPPAGAAPHHAVRCPAGRHPLQRLRHGRPAPGGGADAHGGRLRHRLPDDLLGPGA